MLRSTQLRGQGRLVADFLITNSDKWSHLSVSQLAQTTGVSPSTVRRTLSALGISHLSELTQQAEPSQGSHLRASALPRYTDHAERLLSDVYDTLHELEEQQATLSQAAQLIHDAPFIQVYGSVLSAGIGSMFNEKLSSLGLLCRFTSDTDAVLRVLPHMPPGAVLLCVSLLGATSHMGIRVLASAKRHGVRSIVLTNHQHSNAAHLASLVLTTGIADPNLHYMDLLARSSQLLVLEVLADEIKAVQENSKESRRRTSAT